jgi:hypothetical protein
MTAGADQSQLDMSGMRIETRSEESRGTETPPSINLARERVLEEAMKSLKLQEESGKLGISLVVIGTDVLRVASSRISDKLRQKVMSTRASRRLWEDYCTKPVGWTKRRE